MSNSRTGVDHRAPATPGTTCRPANCNTLVAAAVQLALGVAIAAPIAPALAQRAPDSQAAEQSTGAAALGTAGTGGQATPGKTGATQLGKISVEASEGSYKAEQAQSPKYTEPLRDTPQTIQVITSDLFNQQGATTLTEALRNSPGVGAFYAGENGSTNTGDAIYMRGFDTSNSIFVDGIRDLGSVSRDVFNIGSIEVQKGPAGTDYGRVAPAGSINMSTKEAFLGNAVSGIVSGGTDGQERGTLDLNQTLNGLPGGALRLNVMWQDSDVPGRDHVNNTRSGFAPSLGLGLDGDTRAYLDLLYVKQDNIPDGFVPTIGLPGWSPQPGLEQLAGHPVDPDSYYGTRADYDRDTSKMATLRLEHDFSESLKLSNIARWGETQQDYLLSSFMANNTNVTYTDIDDLSTYSLARSLTTTKDQINKILTDQLNLRADFKTGDVQHHLSTGVELAREELFTYGVTVAGSRPAANLYDPNWNDTGNLSLSRNGAGSHGKTDTVSAYAFDTLKFFDDHLLATVGLRADHYKTEFLNTTACGGTGRTAIACPGGTPVGTPVQTIDADKQGTLFNWKIGVVYKPVEAASLYADYAISQEPPGGASFQLSSATNSLDNPNMDPEKAKTYEVGAKWDVLHEGLSLNLALFRTEVTNEINANELDDNGNPTQTGKKRVQGVEVSAVGNITKDWAVSAGYTKLSTKVQEGPVVTADGSSNLTYAPNDAFTSWTTYRLPFGITLGGGARYTGVLHRGTDNPLNGTPDYVASYVVFDAIASYDINKHFTLRMNAYNLGDRQYVTAINKSGFRYTPGVPRTFLFSGDFRF